MSSCGKKADTGVQPEPFGDLLGNLMESMATAAPGLNVGKEKVTTTRGVATKKRWWCSSGR